MFWGILLFTVLACVNAFYISNPIVRARVSSYLNPPNENRDATETNSVVWQQAAATKCAVAATYNDVLYILHDLFGTTLPSFDERCRPALWYITARRESESLEQYRARCATRLLKLKDWLTALVKSDISACHAWVKTEFPPLLEALKELELMLREVPNVNHENEAILATRYLAIMEVFGMSIKHDCGYSLGRAFW